MPSDTADQATADRAADPAAMHPTAQPAILMPQRPATCGCSCRDVLRIASLDHWIYRSGHPRPRGNVRCRASSNGSMIQTPSAEHRATDRTPHQRSPSLSRAAPTAGAGGQQLALVAIPARRTRQVAAHGSVAQDSARFFHIFPRWAPAAPRIATPTGGTSRAPTHIAAAMGGASRTPFPSIDQHG